MYLDAHHSLIRHGFEVEPDGTYRRHCGAVAWIGDQPGLTDESETYYLNFIIHVRL